MKALTLLQPWASLVAAGLKTIETRSWSTRYRGPLAIHASKGTAYHGFKVGDWSLEGYGDHREIRRLGAVKDGELVADRFRQGLAHPAPLGAVVATCRLVDVVPMVNMAEEGAIRRLEIGDGGSLWISEPDVEEVGEPWGGDTVEISDQAPYGDFRPGRYAWLLEDIQPLGTPIPARGGRKLWEWKDPDAHAHGPTYHRHAFAAEQHGHLLRAVCLLPQCEGFPTHNIHADPGEVTRL
jgi:activating signal cointegrator 1